LRIEVGNLEAACRVAAAGAGVGIVPASVALKHAYMLDTATVALRDDWAERRLNICVCSMADLPGENDWSSWSMRIGVIVLPCRIWR
jgi:DNA-binding transcriptional LysR family regulator